MQRTLHFATSVSLVSTEKKLIPSHRLNLIFFSTNTAILLFS